MDCLKCKENIQEYLDRVQPLRAGADQPLHARAGCDGVFVNPEDISSAKGGSAYGTGLQEKDCIRKEIERHLEDCFDCRREYRLFKVIDHLLKTQPMETPPPDLPNLVMNKIEQSSPRFATLSGLPGRTARRADRIRRDRKLTIEHTPFPLERGLRGVLIPIGAIAALLLMGTSLWTATSLFKGRIETIIEKDFTSLVEKVTSFPTIGKGFSFSMNNDYVIKK